MPKPYLKFKKQIPRTHTYRGRRYFEHTTHTDRFAALREAKRLRSRYWAMVKSYYVRDRGTYYVVYARRKLRRKR